MGIRFLCHQCEKRLNVKSTQAGQEGQCPHCMASIVVPEKSTIPSQLEKLEQIQRGQERAAGDEDSAVGLYDVDDQTTLDGIPAEKRHQDSVNSTKLKKKVAAEFNPDDSNSSIELFMLDRPAPPSTLGKIDPIAEAPDRVWYFRSRELGEKGPLKGKVMQAHLERGDVKIGCFVWREDWEDWVAAEKVFPTLVAEAKSRRRKARVSRAFKEANYQLPDDFDPDSEFSRRKRRKHQFFAGAIATGVVIIVILVVVLIQLLSK